MSIDVSGVLSIEDVKRPLLFDGIILLLWWRVAATPKRKFSYHYPKCQQLDEAHMPSHCACCINFPLLQVSR